jgi:hypothetical protein
MLVSLTQGDDDMRCNSALFALLIASALVLVASCGGESTTTQRVPAPTKAQPQEPASGAMPPGAAQATPGELPAGHPPIGAATSAAPALEPPPRGSGTGATAMSWSAPKGWIEEQPSSAMRKAQYRVPGPGGDGECVVFYFGPGQGGAPMENAQRWASQFRKADGNPATDQARTSTVTVGELEVLMVEVAGTYAGGMSMGMPAAEEKPGYMLLGAIAEGPDANWFFKLTGPEETVKSQRAAFEQMAKSLKRGA